MSRLPSTVSTVHDDARQRPSSAVARAGAVKKGTHSLPVQYVLESLASHATMPRSSSGRPRRPVGFWLDHFSSKPGCESRNSPVNLQHRCVAFGQCWDGGAGSGDVRGVDVARAEGVDADAVGCPFGGETFGDGGDGGFRGVVEYLDDR